MANEKAGKNLLVKVLVGGSYVTVGGLQTKELQKEAENIEVTNHESGEWREYLTGAGLRGMTISGSGIHNGAASLQTILDAWRDRDNVAMQFIDDDGSGTPVKTYAGNFKVPSFTWGGPHDQAQTWSATFVSNGEITES